MEIQDALELITRGVDVRGFDIIKNRLENRLPVKGFWGTAPTGKPHIGYLLPCIKILELVTAGVETSIVFADTYAFLINYVETLERVSYRTRYYQFLLAAILDALGVPTSKVAFITESERFTFDRQFITEEHQLCALASQDAVKGVGSEIHETPQLSPLLCTGRQSLIEAHLGVHLQLGGQDQCGVLDFANLYMPKFGYPEKARLINPLLPALDGAKMSSSKAESSKIQFLDSPEIITEKIMGAFYDHDVDNNVLLAMIKLIILPVYRLKGAAGQSPAQFSCVHTDGHTEKYSEYENICRDCTAGKLAPNEVKSAVALAMVELLGPIRQAYESNQEWQEIEKLAYPGN